MYNKELADRIVGTLADAFPRKLQLDELQAAMPEYVPTADSDWLFALDALKRDGRVEFAEIRSGTGDVLGMAANITVSAHERQEPRAPNEKKLVFISCGQSTEQERMLGQEVAEVLTGHGFSSYFAQNQETLEGVTENILKRLNAASGFIAILHPRGIVNDANKSAAWTRGSVWVEQEIAIAAFISQALGKPLKVKVFVHADVRREGLRDKLHLNPTSFKEASDIIAELRACLPGWRGAGGHFRSGRCLAPILRAQQLPISGGTYGTERLFQFVGSVRNDGLEPASDYELRVYFPGGLIDGTLPDGLERIGSRPGLDGFSVKHSDFKSILYGTQESNPLMRFQFVVRTEDEAARELEAVVYSGNMPPVKATTTIGDLIRS